MPTETVELASVQTSASESENLSLPDNSWAQALRSPGVSESDEPPESPHGPPGPVTLVDDTVDKRKAILAAAIQLGTERGDEAVTVRGIAARVRISPTALYQYFASKASVLEEVGAEAEARLRRALDAAVVKASEPMDALFRLSLAYVEFACENPWLYAVICRDSTPGTASLGRGGATVFINVASPCFRGAANRTVDLRVVPVLLWIAVHGLATVLVDDRRSTGGAALGHAGERRIIEAYLKAQIRGLET